MEVSIRGGRVFPDDWSAAQRLPKADLPPLTAAQLKVARQLRIREEDYARNELAVERTSQKLLTKIALVGRLIERQIRGRGIEGTVERIVLDTLHERFELEVRVDGDIIPLRMDERLLDALLEKGSPDAERRLSRILDFMLPAGVTK